MDSYGDTVRSRLAWAVKGAGIDQVEFAKRVGASPATVSKWLSGAIAISDGRLAQFAGAVGVRTPWLAHGHGDPYPPEAPPGMAALNAKLDLALDALGVEREIRDAAVSDWESAADDLPPDQQQQ